MSSKIKVDTIENVAGSGNVSLGSGHNLVVPGNITGQGTAAITSNATVGGTLGVTGTSALTGNVGIGAAAGGNPLVVQSDSGAGGIDLLGRSSDNTSTMLSGKSADGNTTYNTITSYANRMRIQSGATSSNTNTMEFFVNDVSRMVIDANGYVTRPKTAGFFIGGTSAVSVPNSGSTGAVTYTSGNILTSSTEIDPDSVFDHTTGKFTAPVAGDYYFCFSIAVSYSSNYHYSYIRKNNSDISGFSRNSAQSSDYIVNTIQGVMTLAANDFVTCARNTNYNAGAVVAPMFSGFLIG